ncbi:hypothetical protein [Streptomyces sp. NPDC056387]|uniref:hypothetical protein n=1 Tax=Streptomyces sp. NPDC056387 TaxID=3345803 RepID=UPI0035D9C956
MDMAGLGALAAVLSIPAALVTAWWSKRSSERAADAAIAAGRRQADASLEVAHVQGRTEGLTWHRTRIDAAAAEFLRASDALIRTVKQLPGVAHEERHPLLFEHANAVGGAYPALELIAPVDLLASARALRMQCLRLERLALDRAVLRAALAALEAERSPGSAEVERCPAAWAELVGGWVRDPLMERAESAREAFVAAVRAAIPESTTPTSPV